ncbi:MAG: cytochrome c biogenesis protein CcsA [Verrucomicrobiae bacterium]|nr:cytochrome c biogenesis protein CcsA [Verrucomicrobiae bacterium]
MMNAQAGLFWMVLGLYGLGLFFALWRLAGARAYRLWPKLAIVLPAFLLHTGFLWEHGLAQGRCPVATFFETLVFIAWCVVALQLALSLAFRLNYLTVFAMPLVLLCLLAALAVGDRAAARIGARGIWLGTHAAVDILAFAALALSGVASLMYLIQEFQLRRHRLSTSFMLLPPMLRLQSLATWLLAGGFLLYTAGLVGGVAALVIQKTAHTCADAKLLWAAGVWFYYLVLVVGRTGGRLSGRRFAWLCLGGAVFVLATFALANAWSGFHRFDA